MAGACDSSHQTSGLRSSDIKDLRIEGSKDNADSKPVTQINLAPNSLAIKAPQNLCIRALQSNSSMDHLSAAQPLDLRPFL